MDNTEEKCAQLDRQLRHLLGLNEDAPAETPISFGWYSKMRSIYGTMVYTTLSDAHVEITRVTSGYEPRGGYPESVTDVQCVGPVIQYVRRGRASTSL